MRRVNYFKFLIFPIWRRIGWLHHGKFMRNFPRGNHWIKEHSVRNGAALGLHATLLQQFALNANGGILIRLNTSRGRELPLIGIAGAIGGAQTHQTFSIPVRDCARAKADKSTLNSNKSHRVHAIGCARNMNGGAAVAVAMNSHNMKNRTVAELGIALAQFAPRVINEMRFTSGNKRIGAHKNSRRTTKPDQTLRRIGVVGILAQCNSFAILNVRSGAMLATSMRWRGVRIVLQIFTRLVQHDNKDEQHRCANHHFSEKPVVIGSNQR